MKRFSGRLCAMIAAVVVVVMIAQVAVAQNESKKGRGGRSGGGGGMMGPPSMARIAGNEKVQEALKLSDDQKSKIKTINEESMTSMREARSSGARDPEKMRKMRDEETEKLNKVLDEGQQKRLMGIFVQLMGAGAVMDPAVGKEIGLTEDQKTKLHDAMGPPPEGRAAGGQGFQERREKMEKDVMSVLTSDQKTKLESLKGEKVDIDPSSIFRGGGRGGEGRPRRNRGSDSAPKKSAA